MGKSVITVIKATGEKEVFSEEKVRRSIKRAGIAPELEEQVISHVKSIIYPNITTGEIYKHIIEFLGKSPVVGARAKYSLKKAIMKLGPTGYPFEKFVASIFKENGYSVKTNLNLRGKCVTHEVDVMAEKNNERLMIEAKFHNRPGTRSDVKTALYTYARFLDLLAKDKSLTKPCLVTNTKATSDAISYAECMGMEVIAWSYPEKDSLRDLIEKANLHPVTVLEGLSNNQLKNLFLENIILCRDIISIGEEKLKRLGIPEDKIAKLKKEAEEVCKKI